MIDKWRLQCLDSPTTPALFDRSIAGQILSITSAVGGGAGQTVSTPVTFTEALPTSYQVLVEPKQAAVWWITARTTYGFTVNTAPLLPTSTLAASTIDVTILTI